LLNELHNDINTIDKIPVFTYTEKDFDNLSNDQKSRIQWNRYRSYENSPILDIFAGQLESVVTCQYCKTQSNTYEVFWDLSIPVSDGDSDRKFTLEDCLKAYFKEEVLETTYKCSKCKENREATKKLSISRYPSVFVLRIILLIRFKKVWRWSWSFIHQNHRSHPSSKGRFKFGQI
jgi:ubiquitin C-terminal hydrolase